MAKPASQRDSIAGVLYELLAPSKQTGACSRCSHPFQILAPTFAPRIYSCNDALLDVLHHGIYRLSSDACRLATGGRSLYREFASNRDARRVNIAFGKGF